MIGFVSKVDEWASHIELDFFPRYICNETIGIGERKKNLVQFNKLVGIYTYSRKLVHLFSKNLKTFTKTFSNQDIRRLISIFFPKKIKKVGTKEKYLGTFLVCTIMKTLCF